jgi:vesicle coat complex subunit
VLQLATAESDNPDIRDRAYVYWRLLSGDLDVAKVSPSGIQIRVSSWGAD